MKKLGIIQPGKIGDIIICLPIAKYYYDKGYEIIWPVDRNIIDNFINYVDYVKFIPIDFDCRLAHQVCFNHNCNTVIDVSFTLPGANSHNTERYLNRTYMQFDEFKYAIANVPFEEKWNLQIKRNINKEQQLYEYFNINEPYVIVQWNGSDRRREVQFDNPNNVRIIEVSPLTSSVFDWLTLLEKSQMMVLIDSSIANLCDQLAFKQKKYLLTRELARPTFKEEWVVID